MIPLLLRTIDRATQWAAARVLDVDRDRAVYRLGEAALEVHRLRLAVEHGKDWERELAREREHALASAVGWKALAKALRASRLEAIAVAVRAQRAVFDRASERDAAREQARAYAAQRDAAVADVRRLEATLDGDGEPDRGTLGAT